MRTGTVMDVYTREGPASGMHKVVADLERSFSKSFVWRHASLLDNLLRTPVARLRALIAPGGGGGGAGAGAGEEVEVAV